MLAELVRHVIGVDPDRDWVTLAVVDAGTTGVVAHGRFPATAAGYRQAIELADAHGEPTERAWAIEGTASYGRGLTMALERAGEWVIEFDRPTRKTKDGAKSDHLDAVRAARETLGRDRHSQPRAHDGAREAIRVHAVTRAAAVRARTGAINELKAMIVAADEELRAELRGMRTSHQVARCLRFRDRADWPVARRSTRLAMRALARRISHLSDEIDEHDRALKALLDAARRARRRLRHRRRVLPRLVASRPLPRRGRLRSTRGNRTGRSELRTAPNLPPAQPRR
jgi:transposase